MASLSKTKKQIILQYYWGPDRFQEAFPLDEEELAQDRKYVVEKMIAKAKASGKIPAFIKEKRSALEFKRTSPRKRRATAGRIQLNGTSAISPENLIERYERDKSVDMSKNGMDRDLYAWKS